MTSAAWAWGEGSRFSVSTPLSGRIETPWGLGRGKAADLGAWTKRQKRPFQWASDGEAWNRWSRSTISRRPSSRLTRGA